MGQTVNTAQLLLQVDASSELLRRNLAIAKKEIDGFAATTAKTSHEVDTSLRTIGNGAKFSTSSLLELGHVGRSVTDSIIAGASPLRAFAVEAGRIGEVIERSGGVNKALNGLIGLVGGPFVVGLAAGAAALAYVGYAANEASAKAAAFDNSLKITGNSAGLTKVRFDELGQQIATAAGVGVHAGEEMAKAFQHAGVDSRTEITQLGVATLELADYTGRSTDDIVKDFAKAKEAPTKYAEEVARAYNLLTPAQVEHIRRLEEEGRKSEAFAALSHDVYTTLGTYGPAQLSVLGKAFRDLEIWADRATAAIDRVFEPKDKGRGVAAQIDGLVAQRKALTDAAERRSSQGYGPDTGPSKAEAASLKDRGYNVPLSPAAQITAINAQIAALQAQKVASDAVVDAGAKRTRDLNDSRDAAKDLEAHFQHVGDNIERANTEIARFRKDIADTLKGDPTNAVALDRQKNAARIEEDIRKKNLPDTTRDEAKAAAAAAKAAAAKLAADKVAAERLKSLEKEVEDVDAKISAAGVKLATTPEAKLDLQIQAEQAKTTALVNKQKLDGTKDTNAAQATERAKLIAGIKEEGDIRVAEVNESYKRQHATTLAGIVEADDQILLQNRSTSASLILGYRDRAAAETGIISDEVDKHIAHIQREIDTVGKYTAAEKAALQQQQAGLQASKTLQTAVIDRQSQGPLKDYLDTLPTTADNANKAFGNAAVDGLRAFDDGIVAALTHSKNLGDVFHGIANTIITDLLRIGVEKAIVGPLANALGFGESGGGSIITSLSHILGFASGGVPPANQISVVGEHGPELLVGDGRALVQPMRGPGVFKAGGDAGGGLTVSIGTIDARGSNDPAAVRAQVQQGIYEAAPALNAGIQAGTLAKLQRPSLPGHRS